MDRDRVQAGETERRYFGGGSVELREADDGETKRGIKGLAIPTNVTADIGWFTESIARSAVTDAIEQGWDVRGLFNHDPNMILGKTTSGTMTMKATRTGLTFDIPELPEARSDVLEAIKRGDVDGNSFSFTVAKEEWDESEELEKPHRTIKKFGRLFDVGPVTFPAYAGQTTVSARAMEMGAKRDESEATDSTDDDTAGESAEAEVTDNVSDRRRQVEALEADLATE